MLKTLLKGSIKLEYKLRVPVYNGRDEVVNRGERRAIPGENRERERERGREGERGREREREGARARERERES